MCQGSDCLPVDWLGEDCTGYSAQTEVERHSAFESFGGRVAASTFVDIHAIGSASQRLRRRIQLRG